MAVALAGRGGLRKRWLRSNRQLSLAAPSPVAGRWRRGRPLVKHPKLLAAMERRLVRAVWAWAVREAKRLGAKGALHGGTVGFRQYFGSALQLTPQVHVLVPEGLWTEDAQWAGLPPPTEADVARIARRVVKRLSKDFARRRGVAGGRAGGVVDGEPPGLIGARGGHGAEAPCAAGGGGGGVHLHADTWVHGHDRDGLERLCRYGSRGPVANERLSRREDGRYEYRTRKGKALVKRLLAVMPPRGVAPDEVPWGVRAEREAAVAGGEGAKGGCGAGARRGVRSGEGGAKAASTRLGEPEAQDVRGGRLAVPVQWEAPGGDGGQRPEDRGGGAAEHGPVAAGNSEAPKPGHSPPQLQLAV
jgi:hypothetical protein